MVGTISFRHIYSSLALTVSLLAAGSAGAQLMEPPDTVHPNGFGPIPVDPRSLCLKTDTKVGGSIGCTGSTDTGDYQQWSGNANTLDNMSLMGLFKYYETDATGNVLVDYAKDANTEPATFNPLCNIQGTMVMHGGGCLVDFGWYCADGTASPTIYPLVTSAQILAYATLTNPPYPKSWQDSDGSFLPKTSYMVAGTALSDVPNDANFKACSTKKIGFAVKGNSTNNCDKGAAACACTQNKYTERALNQLSSASNQPYITAVIYPSKVTPGRFYIAVEDLPTSAAQFDAPYVHKDTSSGQNVTWNADGDFNDFVYIVEGVVCQGGGQLCTVPNQQGICATGVTACSTDPNGDHPCDAVFKPQTEICNAIDDDCDGQIDNGDNLCPAGQTCYQGSCVSGCAGTGEFACPTGQVCVGSGNGYCIDASCATVSCAQDQTCVNGQCVGGCDNVTCLAGEQCVAGKCVDLCDAREQAGLAACPDNFVCQNGACVPNCTCLPCPNDQECQTDSSQTKTFGRCVASGCSNVNCGADQVCVPGGNCVTPCDPNPCASGQNCTPAKSYDSTKDTQHQYSCTNPNDTTAGGAGTGGASSICLGNGCTTAGSGNSNNSNNSNNSSSNASNGTSTTKGVACGCRVVARNTSGWGLFGLAGLVLLSLRRRRAA